LRWLLIFSGALFFAHALSLQAEKFALVYRRPLLYSVVGIVFLGLIGGFVLERLHIMIGSSAKRGDNVLTDRPACCTVILACGIVRDVHEGEIVGVSNGLAYHRRAKRPILYHSI